MKQFMLIALMALVSVISAGAQTSEKSTKATSTEILQTTTVPVGTTIHEGTTRSGNPKFWVTLKVGDQSVNVTVSQSLAVKFKAGSAKIEVVKRRNKTTGKITYTSRTLGGARTSKPNTDINLTQASFK